MPYASLAADLARLDTQALRRRRRVLDSPQSARVTVDGRAYVAFCSNDYLGLAASPELARAACEGVAQYGVGAGASHLVLGHSTAHERLEAALAAFTRTPRALLFSTGYMANLGAVTALVGRDDAVFADRLNHASLNDAVQLSRAAFRRYAHADLAALERLLAASTARRKLIVSDAVFSMDGDIAPVPQLLQLAQRHDAWLFLDDAHGFGVLGDDGRGTLAHFDVRSPRIVYMATLGKAAGVAGAFVAGDETVIETLLQRARTYVYTTAAPPMLAHALLQSLHVIAHESWRRDRLNALIALTRHRLAGLRWRLMPSTTAIQPLLVGENADAVRLADGLAQRGLLVPAIRPPTVAPGTARLRISLTAAHSDEDVEQLAAALAALQ